MKENIQKPIVQLSQKAFKKIVYHCLRYPSSKVYGIIVGPSPNNISDAYPLFHTPLVNPSLTIAINLVQSNIQQGDYIQGFYQFVEKGDMHLPKILETNTQAKDLLFMRVWTIDHIISCAISEKQLQYINFDSLKDKIKDGQHRLIVDMDAHFQDINLDFRNSYIK